MKERILEVFSSMENWITGLIYSFHPIPYFSSGGAQIGNCSSNGFIPIYLSPLIILSNHSCIIRIVLTSTWNLRLKYLLTVDKARKRLDKTGDVEVPLPEGYFVGEVDDALLQQWKNNSMWEPWDEEDLQDVVPERPNAVFTYVDDCIVFESILYIYVHMSYLLFWCQCPLSASAYSSITPIVRIITMNPMLPPVFLPHLLFYGPPVGSSGTPPQEESPLKNYTPLSMSPSRSPLVCAINRLEISDLLNDPRCFPTIMGKRIIKFGLHL